MTDFKYNFGDSVYCKLKDYGGIIYVKSEYATGCIQYGIHIQSEDESQAPWLVFEDEGVLTLVEASKMKRVPKQVERYDFK